jgi:NAD+ synthase (glutamine-hydrolysing)
MKIALAQINPKIADFKGNSQKILHVAQDASAKKAELVIFPELSLCGYPPKDLVLRRDFLENCQRALQDLSKTLPIAALVGAPVFSEDNKRPFNAALLIHNNQVKVLARKRLLPNYNIFDEERHFTTPESSACDVFDFMGKTFLISICEDAWNSNLSSAPAYYKFDPIAESFKSHAHATIDYIVNISASPYSKEKPRLRENVFKNLAKSYQVPVLMCGQVGANDQLLFDGQSMIVDENGEILERAEPCVEKVLFYDENKAPKKYSKESHIEPMALVHQVLVMGIKDYVDKCGASGVILGLSGGIDSALCAALCVEALGKSRVRALFLPSVFSSNSSLLDAKNQALNLAINLEVIGIEDLANDFRTLLKTAFNKAGKTEQEVSDQNLQSRIRALLIMAFANLSNDLMIATSNKSELAVGYGTLYGDMSGAFAPIGDLYKSEVYELANYVNKIKAIIPESIINKIPTAELKLNQRDEDDLPPYDILDIILKNYIDYDMSLLDIQKNTNININTINKVVNMIHKSEFKRRQAPFPLMTSQKVFGDARRIPIAKAFYDLAT